MKNLFRPLLSLALFAALAAGCARDEADNDRPDYLGKVATVAFDIELPAPSVVETRGGQTLAEAQVDNIYLLIFKNDGSYLDCKVIPSSSITTSNGSGSSAQEIKTFTTAIPVSASSAAADRYDIVLLANVSGDLAAAVAEQITNKSAKSAFLGALEYAADGNPAAPFPMASLNYGAETITVTSNFTGVNAFKLMRMVARVDVNFAGTLSGYTVEEVLLYDYNRKGCVWHNGLSTSPATATNIPSATGVVAGSSYSVTNTAADKTSFAELLYALEADVCDAGGNPLDVRPCLVVKLTDGTNDLGYYRIDFKKSDGTWLNIIRNHRYIFSITKVSGTGFDDPDTAYNAGPMNIEVGVINWDDSQFSGGIWNGKYDIRFGSLNAVFGSKAPVQAQTFTIMSNVPKLTLSDFVNDDTAGDGDWTETSPGSYQWSNGHFTVVMFATPITGTDYKTWTIAVQTADAAASDPDRKTTFKIGGEGLETTFTITQKGLAESVPAFEGILAVDENGVLNLDGRGQTVYFKYGSLVALAGGSGDAFDASDVVWAPAEYPKGNLIEQIGDKTKMDAYKLVPYADAVSFPDGFSGHLLSLGIGDPCRLASKSGVDIGDFMMPAGNPYNQGAKLPVVSGGTWSVSNGVNGHWYNVGQYDAAFYPAAGFRTNTNGNFGAGGINGYFWTSTAASSDNAYSMQVYQGGVNHSTTSERAKAFPIRCMADVRGKVTIPTKGIDAVENILSVDDQGVLNLDGRGKIVLFKWGSLIATQGCENNVRFNAYRDIAWVPPGFNVSRINGEESAGWRTIPHSSINGIMPDMDLEAGLGDPCRLASKGGETDTYRMPMGNPYRQFLYDTERKDNPKWMNRGGVNGMLDDVSIPNQFYPAAGFSDNGTYKNKGIQGYYYSATTVSETYCRILTFSNKDVSPTSSGSNINGFAVRCVPTVPAPTQGVDAVENILAVDNQGVLNLDGRGKMVYFKWNSVIGVSVYGTDVFDQTDVVWIPDGYDYYKLMADIGPKTATSAWNLVPYNKGAAWVDSDYTNGIGDPCKLAEKDGVVGGYKTPNGNPYNGVSYTTSTLVWGAVGGVQGATAKDDKQFYPAAGCRSHDTGEVKFLNVGGYFWTRYAGSLVDGSYLSSSYNSVEPSNSNSRNYGFNVRCVKE